MSEFKVGDKFRIRVKGGSFGKITQVVADGYYGKYYYGLDVKGEPMTANSHLLSKYEIKRVSEEEFLAVRNRRGFGSKPRQKSALYYVQDARQIIGNSVLWWAKNKSGYTCHLEQAHKFTELEIAELDRETDVPWRCEIVDKAASLQVDMQHLRRVNREAKVK